MNRGLLANVFRLKLEVLGLVAELLPEPVKDNAVKYKQELLQVVHQVTGEYLAEERADSAKQGVTQKVEIQ